MIVALRFLSLSVRTINFGPFVYFHYFPLIKIMLPNYILFPPPQVGPVKPNNSLKIGGNQIPSTNKPQKEDLQERPRVNSGFWPN